MESSELIQCIQDIGSVVKESDELFPENKQMEFIFEGTPQDSFSVSVEEGQTKIVLPKDVKFSQASISREFRRIPPRKSGEPGVVNGGSYAAALKATVPSDLSLESAVQQLRDGELKVTDFPPIRIVSHRDRWYSLDNRRLWVFREYGEPIPAIVVKADKEFFQKFSGEGDGESVTFITPDDAKEYKKSRTLMSEVLKWSVKDIMNENLLKNKVQPIPVRFASLSKYLEVFKNPLVEEIRAQLQQSLEGIRSSSYISLRGVEERPSKNDLDKDQFKKFMLIKDPDAPIVDGDNKKKLSWNPKPTDLILLTTVLPRTDYRELERSEVCYAFGLLKGGVKDDDVLLSIVFAPSESPEYIALKDETYRWYAVHMGCMATGIRIWEALERSMPDEMNIYQQPKQPLLECLYTESTSETGFDDLNGARLFVNESVPDQNPEIIASYCRYRGLNESQATAVTTVAHGLLQRQRPYIRLIQGPPGTGKTFTLATLFTILSCLKQRILICAPTNVAVSEVALRFLEFFDVTNAKNKVSGTQYGQFLELSNMGIESSTLSSITLGDVVLIGNDDRLDVKGPLGQVYLDSRVDRLQHALSTITGWRASASKILEFLESASLQYDNYQESNEGDKSCFVEFFRRKIAKLAVDFEDNFTVLSADLPSKFLTARSKEIFRTLSFEIKKFVDLVTRTSLEEAEAYLLFQEPSSFESIFSFSRITQERLTDTGAEVLEATDELKVALSTLVMHLNEIFIVPPKPTREWVRENCLKHAWLVFSTVSSSGRQIVLRSKPFECVIVDEAAQCVEAETIIVTSMREVKQVVLVGDHMQLPATVISQISQDCGYARSLFERLQSLGHPMNLLNVQYRMHPAISMFPNMKFYNGKVEDGANVMKSAYSRAPYQKQLFGPYTFINVHDGNEERDEDEGKSWKNPVEVAVVVYLVSKISTACRDAKAENVSIGVISPYQSQVKELEKMLSRYDNIPSCVTVEVKSVDGFQGREKDIIVFSSVRSNSGGHIGFLKDHRRLNVAITRAKYCLWVIGNERTLTSNDEVWKALISDAKERKCVTNPGDHPEMKKLIRHVKEELNQLAELLNPNSILFNGTVWKVLFAKEMKTTFSQVTSTGTRQQFLNTMLNLANGRRSPYPTASELVSARYRKLIQVQPVADFYLVWTVDIENKQPTVEQIVKVWNAVRHADLSRLLQRLEGGLSTCTDIYLERCAKKQYDTSFGSTKKFLIPAKWKWDASFVKFKSLEKRYRGLAAPNMEQPGVECAPILEKSAVDESVLLMKFYPLSSGIARQLLTASDGSQLSLPFEVDEHEAAIIQYQKSSFIIGRSGTGKTTVITTKLLQREQDFWIAMNSIPRVDNDPDKACSSAKIAGSLKQVLITLSPKLCAAVKHNISKTRRSMQEAAGGVVDGECSDQYEDMMLDDEAEAKLMGSIPDSFANVPSDCYPLVVTYRKFLTMLDGSVSEPFFPSTTQELREIFEPRLNADTKEGSESVDLNAGHGSSHEVINFESEKEDEDFSDVEDENLSEDENDSVEQDRDKSSGATTSVRKFRVTEVDFERFESMYWPRFNSKLTKNLDSSLVYTEIISHIKGSIESLHSPFGFLSREDYISMARRRTSVYNEQQREDIYSLFLQYEKKKRENREYDAADLVTHLYSQLQDDNYLGEKMHFVYVDEVQDFTQAQIALFKFISDNLEDGFLFAGDTAQTIARGVGFRFEDVRRLFYEEFIRKKDSSGSSGMKVPDLFQLSMNFRTHMGVVGIADSIIQLLQHFFPQSIDKLDPESSLLQGEIPIFLKTQQNRGLVTSLFDMGGITGGGGCEFGAEQVILVRDNEAKNYLVKQVGQRGIVLTVHECKGLEFQDVLLYNFFTNSPMQNKWRVIYGFMEAQNLVSCEKYSYPCFDVKRHNLLCNELKQLYVVLTRARQRLWIYDECVEHHQPMLDYWMASGLVQVKQLDASLAEELQGKSSPEDWKKRGIKMFNERHYDAAMLCFDRAGDAVKAQHAKAAGFEQAAEKLQCINVKEATRLLREAAELFKSLQKGDAAAKCYIKLGDFKKAGTTYLEVCKPPKLEEAGDCFSEAKCWEEAAHAYFDVNTSKCLSSCWRGKLLDLGLSFIQKWESGHRRTQSSADVVDSSDTTAEHRDSQQLQRLQVADPVNEKLEFDRLKTDFLKKAASLHHQSRNTTEMMKFVRMFPSLAMRRSFLKRRDYDEQLELIEEDAGNLGKAAELAESRGDLRRAAKLLEQSGFISLAVEKLLHVVTMEIQWGNPEDRALVQQDLENVLSMANRDNSGVGEALVHETRILMLKIQAEDPCLFKLDIFKEIWKQARKLKVLRLELLSSQVLLQELLRMIRCSLEETEKPVVNTSIGEFRRVVREHLPDLIEVWKHWSKLMVLYVRAIERSQKGRGRDEDELILECVHLHLGVRKHSQHDSLLVENRNMLWIGSQEGDISANHAMKRGSLSIREFSGLAFEYFSTQIHALGIGELFSLMERVHRRLGTPVLESNDDSVFSSIDSIRILMFSFNILSTVLEVRTWEEEPKSKMNRAILICSRQLYELFFLTLPAGSLKELQIARESSDANLIFETLAVDLSYRKPLTFDAVGILVTLHPFLGREWADGKSFMLIKNMKFTEYYFKDYLWKATHWQHGATLKSTRDNQTTKDMLRCSFWSKNLMTYISALRIVFRDVNPNMTGYISPLVFLALLERGVVAACACTTHLKSMIMSENMALYCMGGKHHASYYSMLLNCTCDAGCKHLSGALFEVVRIIVELLFEVLDLEKWLHMARMDPKTHLSPVILRLLKLLITICINNRHGFIHDYIIQNLKTLFEGQSPILAELPVQFFKELEQVFISSRTQPVPIFRLMSAFSFAMKSIDDRLVILRKTGRQLAAGMSWHEGALKKLKLITVRVNQLCQSEFSLASLEPNLAPSLDELNLQKSVSHAGTRDSNSGTLISESEDQNRLATIKDTVEEDSQENEVVSNIVEESSYSTFADTTEDTWRPDMTDMSSPKPVMEIMPYSNTSGVVRLEDGTTLSRKFVEQLQKLLQSARDRIAMPLTPLESYQRQARSVFLRRGISDNRYLGLFVSDACLLQVDVFERLATLNKALEYIKGDHMKLDNGEELLEKFSDHKEGLEEALEHLNPKAVIHEEEDLDWLEGSIQSLRVMLENGHSHLQGHIKQLFRSAGEVMDAQSSPLHPTSKSKREGSQISSAQPPQMGKKAQQKKKRNKKRNKKR